MILLMWSASTLLILDPPTLTLALTPRKTTQDCLPPTHKVTLEALADPLRSRYEICNSEALVTRSLISDTVLTSDIP